MSEQIIKTKRGIYGKVSITLPLPMKTAMLGWAKSSGMKKAEFLRLALTTGFLELSKSISTDDLNLLITDAEMAQGQPARTLGEDGLPAPMHERDTGLS